MLRLYTILVMEENDYLREKTAGVISRNGKAKLVVQSSAWADIESIVESMHPDVIVLGLQGALKHCSKVERLNRQYNGSGVFIFADEGYMEDLTTACGSFNAGTIIGLSDLVETISRTIQEGEKKSIE